MPDDNRTPNEIEREIEYERAELANTVEELQDRFSPENIMRDVARGFSEHGGDIGQSISRSVKENPVALALTGVGLAWMIFGKSNDRRSDAYEPSERDRVHDNATARARVDRAANYERESDDTHDDPYPRTTIRRTPSYASGTSGPRRAAFSTSRRYESDADWAYADYDYDDDYGDDDDGLLERASDAVSSGAKSTKSAVGSAGETVSSGASSAADGVKNGAQRASSAGRSGARTVADGFESVVEAVKSVASSAADTVSDAATSATTGASNAANSASSSAAKLRDQLAEGTENMSETARNRVILARARFIDARRKADEVARRKASRGADSVGNFIDEQPLVAGALAMAVGAAIAGALPRTRQEDDMFGAKSDELYDSAERIFYRESSKAQSVAEAAVGEAQDIAQEKRRDVDEAAPGSKSAVEAAADEARRAGERIADAAKSEADARDLGNPKSSS